jgi:ribosomal protein L11 methyltransferase
VTSNRKNEQGTFEISIIDLSASQHDFLVAELAELGFVAFQSDPDCLRAYCPATEYTGFERRALQDWVSTYSPDATIRETLLPPRNWNAEWEKTIKPVRAGGFVILPGRYRDITPDDHITLWIDPKMSFGTGHHETTRLVLSALPEVCSKGDRVLDVGTGTGVLAIAAAKLGAAAVDACDTDSWSAVNAVENIRLNDVATTVRFFPGSLDDVPPACYDVVLANIQYNVLHALLPDIGRVALPSARIVLSGLLRADEAAIRARADALGFVEGHTFSEGDWIAILLHKPR